MRDAVMAQDHALGELVTLLDEEVGSGGYVIAVTSDHGHTPDPEVSGATAISPPKIADAVGARFDTDGDDVKVVEFTQPTMMHIDTAELEEQGATLEDVSRFILTLTKRQVLSPQWPGPVDELDDLAFEAAYPSSWLETLSCVPRD
jgi:predicted AlkP superfamily pyrophosphatase or phosphodiesterase